MAHPVSRGRGGGGIHVRSLGARHGRTQVLHGVTFTLAPGSLTGLVGPSGSGKTTLMRTLVGLHAPASGFAEIDGTPVGDPSLRSRIGYSPQGAAVYPDLTVLENVRYFAACQGTPPGEATRVLDAVSLGQHAHRLAGSLSGGERSRASLAVALLGRPRLLVLDEPTVGLDPLLREDLWALFARLPGQGVAVLVSSHVMTEAERCQRVLLLREGRLLADATPDELRRATGAATLDDAFLLLVRREQRA